MGSKLRKQMGHTYSPGMDWVTNFDVWANDRPGQYRKSQKQNSGKKRGEGITRNEKQRQGVASFDIPGGDRVMPSQS